MKMRMRRMRRRTRNKKLSINYQYRNSNTFSDLEGHYPWGSSPTWQPLPNPKDLSGKYVGSFLGLECPQIKFDCHSWDTLAAVPPPFTNGHQAHIDDVQYAGDHNKSHNTESSDHNAWRPPTGARTTYNTYQSSNWTSDLWNRKSIFELFKRSKFISFVNTARVPSNFLSGQIASIKIIIGPLYPVYKRGIRNSGSLI